MSTATPIASPIAAPITTPTAAPRVLPLLTTSAARQYRACPRAYFFSYELGRRPTYVDPNRRFGTLGHHGLEAWWQATQFWQERFPTLEHAPEEALLAALAAVDEEPDTDAFEHAKATALLIGYHARWASTPMRVLGVEVEFTGELLNPVTNAPSRTWRRGGKIDAIARIGEGPNAPLYTVEHKTAGEDISKGSDYWIRLTLDSQVSNYLVGARLLGFDVLGCYYDVIAKPALKPHKATPIEQRKYTKPTKSDPEPRLYSNQRDTDESPTEYRERIIAAISDDPDRYFQRGEVVRLREEEDDAALDVWQVGVQIRDSRRTGIFPRNPDACKRYGRTCEYLPVCTKTASITDASRFRKVERANEELSGVK